MNTQKTDNRLFGLKMAVKATLFSAPFLISACGDGGGGEVSEVLGLGQSSKPVPTEGLSQELSPRELEIKADVRAATVQINTIGDSVLPKGLTSVDIQKRGSGTGFFIDDTGYIVTNNHVVTGAGQLSVGVKDIYIPYPVELVGVAECEDLAVLRTTMANSGFDALRWSDVDPEINMKVGASGFPSDVNNSVTGGSVYTFTTGTINTDVRLNNTPWASTVIFDHSARTAPGNSGGPVVDLDTGDVLGVHYAGNGSRFQAISSSEAKRIVNDIMLGNDVLSTGITAEVVFKYTDKNGNAGLAFLEDIPDGTNREPFGVWVNGLQAGGKAKRIGIQAGDIITAIGGVKLQFDQSDDLNIRRAKSTLGQYCGVLRSNNPNKGTVLDIEIYRPKAGGVTCTGEINGQRLGLKQDTAVSCPSLPPVTNDETNSPVNGDTDSPADDHSDHSAETVVIPGTLCCADYQPDDGDFSGRYMDMYTIYATSSGEVTIEMHSQSIDSYLLIGLMNPDGETVDDVFYDDDSGAGLNARVTFNKQRGREYTILATSGGPEETGAYELRFSGFSNSELPGGHGLRAASTGMSTDVLLQKMEIELAK